MAIYDVTLTIDSDTNPNRLRDILDRITRHTFGSSGEVTNFVRVEDEPKPAEIVTRIIDALEANEQRTSADVRANLTRGLA